MSGDPVAPTRIAVVDDDSGVRVSLVDLLHAMGHDASAYASAREFTDTLALGTPDCLITDLQMPGMDGEQLYRALRAGGYIFPVIFLTAYPLEAARRRLLDAGAHAFLGKPLGADDLASCLAGALALNDRPGCKSD